MIYDNKSGLVIDMQEANTEEIVLETSEEDFNHFLNGRKQYFVKKGMLKIVNEPIQIEEH